MKRFLWFCLISGFFIYPTLIMASIYHVGPGRTYTFCSQVSNLVKDGDTIFIDPGTYHNDVQVTWTKNNLYIAGYQGRPRLEAGAKIASDMSNGKGIFVVTGAGITIENIEFANAKVVDHNGAGIRQEGANMKVLHCKFDGNEMGILTGNIPQCTTTIEYSEFVNGGSMANPGYQHNVYINHIDTLIFRFNYSHDAIAEGHELKSRAKYNFILYNRISNVSTVDSRNIDIPNGGTCIIMGNVIEQGQTSANSNIIGYGLEGFDFEAPDRLYIINNTLVNKKNSGSFIQVRSSTPYASVRNNILVGAKTGGLIVGSISHLDSSYNYVNSLIHKAGFVDSEHFDYSLLPTSPAVNRGMKRNSSEAGLLLIPKYIYKDTCQFTTRFVDDTLDIGAYEYFLETATKESQLYKFVIAPNPFSTHIQLLNPPENIMGLKLFSINGQLMTCQNGSIISTEEVPAGIYFLQILTADRIYVQKVVKH